MAENPFFVFQTRIGGVAVSIRINPAQDLKGFAERITGSSM